MLTLKTEGLMNPIGIDRRKPEFSWLVLSDEVGVRQESYKMVVKEEDGSIVWDSGEVFSDTAVEIFYEGKPLRPSARYSVELTVVDNHGNRYDSRNNFFETGLMLKNEKSLGDGAKWIGADELTLDATSACYFDLRMDLTLTEGCDKAGIIFGANDFRLKNKNFNIWGKAEELNYFKYEVDVEQLLNGTSDTAKLNIYVVGMPVLGQSIENDPNEADFSIEIPNTVISKENVYEKMSISIDTLSNLNQVTFRINGIVADENRQLNPLGNTHDYNTYPNLNEIGFSVAAGEKAIFENIAIHNPGPYSEGILFGEKIGATYDIFKGLDGVHVEEDGRIMVGGNQDILVFADPSYGSAPMLRTEFKAEKKIEKARLYVTAQGIYEMWMNGEKISDHWFNPGNSEYRERIAYHTYDVKELLNSESKNAIAVQLAEGWWSGYQTFIVHNYNFYDDRQALMAKLVIEYTDKTVETIVTDEENWSYYGNGPVEYGSFFQGERYNANKEVSGWMNVDFDEKGWRKAVEIPTESTFENYTFMTRLDEPITVINTIVSKSVQKTSDHKDFDSNYSYIYDMGENVLGVPHIQIQEGVLKAGQQLIIRYAEILYPSHLKEYQEAGIANMMMVENYRAALSTDFYTAKGCEAVVIEPHRTYHGFRFIEISGLSEPLPLECVKTNLLSSIKVSSTYESSNPLVNRLYKNVQNSQNSNFMSLPTDCPQRNERLGWTGDAQVFSMAATYNADVYNFYRQWLYTLRDSQFNTGALPVFAPSYILPDQDKGGFGGFGGVSWDAAIVLIPYNLYRQYGKKGIIRENIEAIDKYLNYLLENPMTVDDKIYNGLTSKTGILADWLSIEVTDYTLINNAVYAYLLETASKMAEIIGHTELSHKYQAAYELTKAEWNELYVDEDGRTRDFEGKLQDTQASYATPLRYGVFNEENEKKAVIHYQETVKRTLTEKGNYTIKTGFSGTPNLVPTLSNYGYIEEAYNLFESTEYASWLYPVINGATSIWERWNSYTVDGGFNGNNSMNSFNHFSLGAIYEWMMGYQLGIMSDEEKSGYKHFILQPQMGGKMEFVKGSFESPYGTIHSGWTKSKGSLWDRYEVKVPANTTADLYLPIEEDAKCEVVCEGVIYRGNTTFNHIKVAHFELVSGSFKFNRFNDGIEVSINQ
ncbi:family 78 glycoside hydrolase catalytic domain [Bacillus sp. ISL-18]|uniref:family 78 glycoside hydrolase catalytic domain n=1 Tax=Bacillus sp. ISL-18 TaxID=2819118 RepID=UPI001BEB4DE9|nr:family 78 glycoside hydrolase catalytic domain [Bacillus sp. ISL-18]MBT2654545.1 family 78 glycoside hydrolase catalytic domain [Bacillus sp. ISL-18]